MASSKLIHRLGLLANFFLRGARQFEHQFLLIGRQPVPDVEVHHGVGRAVIVIGEGGVFRDFVNLERLHVDDGQVAAVDHALFRSRDDLAIGHRHGIAAEPIDGVAENLRLLHADFQAAQVSRFDDRLLRGPEMAKAIVEIAEHLELVVVFDLFAQLVADLAVEHGIGGGVVLDEIRHEECTHLRKYRGGGSGRASHRDAAGLDRIHDLELLRDQRLAEELHFERAVCPRRQFLRHPVEGHGRRFRHGIDVGEDQFLRLGLGKDGCAAGGENARQASAGGEKRTAIEGGAAHKSGWHQVSSGCFLACFVFVVFIVVIGPAGVNPPGSACELTEVQSR